MYEGGGRAPRKRHLSKGWSYKGQLIKNRSLILMVCGLGRFKKGSINFGCLKLHQKQDLIHVIMRLLVLIRNDSTNAKKTRGGGLFDHKNTTKL